MPSAPQFPKIAGAVTALNIAKRDRDDAIRKAHAKGATIREIAVDAEMSPARVHQIIHGR